MLEYGIILGLFNTEKGERFLKRAPEEKGNKRILCKKWLEKL